MKGKEIERANEGKRRAGRVEGARGRGRAARGALNTEGTEVTERERRKEQGRV